MVTWGSGKGAGGWDEQGAGGSQGLGKGAQAFPPDPYGEFPQNEDLQQWGRVSDALFFAGLDVNVYTCYLAYLGAWKPDKNPDEQPFTMAMHARMHPAHIGKVH